MKLRIFSSSFKLMMAVSLLAPVAAFAQNSSSSGDIGAEVAEAAEGGDVGSGVCAAVLPCDERGRVLPEFRNSACTADYERQCNELTRSQYAQCLMAREREQDSLKTRISRLQRQLRAARLATR